MTIASPEYESFTESFHPKVVGKKERGSIWDVVLIEVGPSLNGKFYSAETLKDAVQRGVFNNIKAAEYFFGDKNDHLPSEAAAALPGGFRGNQVGWFENVRFGSYVDSKGKKGEGVLAYFHIFDSAKKLKSDMLQLFEAGKPELLGFSIDAKGLLQRASIGGLPIANVKRIQKVNETTVVNEPAAGGRAIRLVASIGGGDLKESVLPFRDLPLADRAREWDSGAATRRIRAWATDGDEVDIEKYSRAFVILDGPRENLTSYKFPIADVINGRLTAIPRGIFAAAGVLQGARGGTTASAEDQAGARRHLSRYFSKLGMEAPFGESKAVSEAIKILESFGTAWTEGIAGQKQTESAVDHLSRLLQTNLARAEDELSKVDPITSPIRFGAVSRGVNALAEAVGMLAEENFSSILDLCAKWKRAYHLRERQPPERGVTYEKPKPDDELKETALGDFLMAEAEKKGLSSEQLGRRAGISASTVTQIMRGEIKRPPDQRLRGFARALGVSFQRLLNLIPENIRETVDMEEDTMTTPAGAELSYDELAAKLKESEAETATMRFQQKLKGLIESSDLPDAAKERLFKLLSEKSEMSDSDVNEAIKAEAEYLKVVTEARHTRPLNPDGSCPRGFTKRGNLCELTQPAQEAVVVEGGAVEGQTGQASPDSGGKPEGLGGSHDAPGTDVQVTQESYDKIVKGFEGMFQEGRSVDNVPAFTSLHRAFYAITGKYYPEEMMADFLMEAISKSLPPREFLDIDEHLKRTRALGTKIYSDRLRESISTTDFSTAFGDALNKSLQREYRDDPLSDWREIVSRRENLRDLTNNHRIVRIGGYGTLPIVNQKAPYQELGEPTEAVEQLVPKKRGGLAILTLEALLADMLGVVATIPRRLARAANRTVHEVVWDEIESNPVLDADSVALIAAGHNNRLSGDGAISGDNIATLIEALIEQTEQDSGRKLGLMPWRVLVGPKLYQEAWELTNSDVKDITAETATKANFIKGLGVTAMKTIGLGRTSGTENRWYVVANPRDAESIVVGFLGGRDRPEIFTQSPIGATAINGAAFDADQLTFKIRFGVAAKVIDFRWIQGSLTA